MPWSEAYNMCSDTHNPLQKMKRDWRRDGRELSRDAPSGGARGGAYAERLGGVWRLEQCRRRNAQCCGQNEQRIECRIGCAGLDAGHVSAKETRVISQLFLRHAAGRAQLFDAQSEYNARRQSFHAMMLVRIHLLIHTLMRTCIRTQR